MKKSKKNIIEEDIYINPIEAFADSIIDNEFVKSLPVVNTLVALCKTFNNYKDYLSMKKFMLFFNELEDLSEDERAVIYWNLVDDYEKEKVGEQIVLLLEAFTETEKAKLMGQVVRVCTREGRTKKELLKIYYILENCFLEDLKEFSKANRFLAEDDFLVLALSGYGLFNYNAGFRGGGKPRHKSKFGYLVSHVLFDTQMPSDEEYEEMIKNF